jgi:hypothetical protein
MHPHDHALASVRRHGGTVDDYLPLHNWFDATKQSMPDVRHRALRHHAEGIFLAEAVFGPTVTNSDGQQIPVRVLGEEHVLEDLGRIPTAADWLRELPFKPWMLSRRKPRRRGQEAIRAD